MEGKRVLQKITLSFNTRLDFGHFSYLTEESPLVYSDTFVPYKQNIVATDHRSSDIIDLILRTCFYELVNNENSKLGLLLTLTISMMSITRQSVLYDHKTMFQKNVSTCSFLQFCNNLECFAGRWVLQQIVCVRLWNLLFYFSVLLYWCLHLREDNVLSLQSVHSLIKYYEDCYLNLCRILYEN